MGGKAEMISLNICSALNISFGMILDHFSQLEYTSVYFSYFSGCADTDVCRTRFV